MDTDAVPAIRKAYEERRDRLKLLLSQAIRDVDHEWTSWKDVETYHDLVAQFKETDEKSSRNVDSMRRVLVDDILSHIALSSTSTTSESMSADVSHPSKADASSSNLNGTKETQIKVGPVLVGNFSRDASKSTALRSYSSSQLEQLLKRWLHVLGWCTQTRIEQKNIEGVVSGESRPVITIGKAYSCLEDLFECLPLVEVAKWFDWIVEKQDWFSRQLLAATELVFALRTFKVLLTRVYNNGQSHRFAQFAGKVLILASQLLPFYHASGINRRSQINNRRYPIIFEDAMQLYDHAESAEETKNDAELSKESNAATSNRVVRRGREMKPSTPSLFATAAPFIDSTAQGAQTHRNSQHHNQPSKALNKTTHALLWDTLAKFKQLATKMNDPIESPRIDANLQQIEKNVHSLLSLVVNYESTHSYLHSTMVASDTSTFLTLPFATHVELMSPAFRLQVAVQVLIFLKTIERPSAAPLPGTTEKSLTTEGTNLLNSLVKKTEESLISMITKSCYSDAKHSSNLSPILLCEAVLDMMGSETTHTDWKVANCPDFNLQIPLAPSVESSQNNAMEVDIKMEEGVKNEMVDSAMKTDSGDDATPVIEPYTNKRKRQFHEMVLEMLPKSHLGDSASQSSLLLHHSLMDFASSCKRRRDRPLRDGFVGAANSLRTDTSTIAKGLPSHSHHPRFNLGSPSLNALFNSSVNAATMIPALDDALGGIATMASSWRARRVILARDNLHAYVGLALSSSNKEGEPFDIDGFVSASNLNFPSSYFIPKPPPTPTPEPEPVQEPDVEVTPAEAPLESQSSEASKPSTPHPAAVDTASNPTAEEREEVTQQTTQVGSADDLTVDVFEDDLGGLLETS